MVDNSNMPHPKCLGSQKNPGTEPKTCEKGPKLGFEYLPTSKTSHCVRTACTLRAHCVHGIPYLTCCLSMGPYVRGSQNALVTVLSAEPPPNLTRVRNIFESEICVRVKQNTTRCTIERSPNETWFLIYGHFMYPLFKPTSWCMGYFYLLSSSSMNLVHPTLHLRDKIENPPLSS